MKSDPSTTLWYEILNGLGSDGMRWSLRPNLLLAGEEANFSGLHFHFFPDWLT